MSLEEFQSKLLGYEQLLEHQAAIAELQSFAMTAQKLGYKQRFNNRRKPFSNYRNYYPSKKPFNGSSDIHTSPIFPQ
jgi:hypothetical protein